MDDPPSTCPPPLLSTFSSTSSVGPACSFLMSHHRSWPSVDTLASCPPVFE